MSLSSFKHTAHYFIHILNHHIEFVYFFILKSSNLQRH